MSVCFQTLDSGGITLVLVQQLYLYNSSQRACIMRQRVILLWNNCCSGVRGMVDVQKMWSVCLIVNSICSFGEAPRLRLFQFHVEVQCLVFLWEISFLSSLRLRSGLACSENINIRMWHGMVSGSNPYRGSVEEDKYISLSKFRYEWVSLGVKHLGWQLKYCRFEPYKGPSPLSKSMLSQIVLGDCLCNN